MNNDSDNYTDDFDPNQDNNANPWQWIYKAVEIFFESGDDWERKLNQLAEMHPLAITRLKIGIKDWGIILTPRTNSLLNKLEKRSKRR